MAQGRSSPSPVVECSSLPDELLGMVRSKLASLRDRVRFAAVCSSWHAAASRHPAPPALPLLLLSPVDGDKEKRLYCSEDGGILRVPLPTRLHNMRLNGSYDGGWIAATGPTSNPVQIAIVNLFTGVELELSEKQKSLDCTRRHRGPYLVWKTIFSEAPTSSGCIIAAMTDRCNIALCRVGCPDGGWTTEGCDGEQLGDIAFCQGELYGLTRRGENLIRYEMGENEDGAPVVTAAQPLAVQSRSGPICNSACCYDCASYIFELHGKLAMAVMARWSQDKKAFFKVFELVQTNAKDDAHDYQWVELYSLGNYALFLGPAFSSRVVHVPLGGRGGVEGNRIYYSHFRSLRTQQEKEFDGKGYRTKSVCGGDWMYMYRKEDQNADDGSGDVQQITALGYYVIGSGSHVPMWCFPPNL